MMQLLLRWSFVRGYSEKSATRVKEWRLRTGNVEYVVLDAIGSSANVVTQLLGKTAPWRSTPTRLPVIPMPGESQ
jgi:hypothetical protein